MSEEKVTRQMRRAVRREQNGGPHGPTPTPPVQHNLVRKRAKAARKVNRNH